MKTVHRGHVEIDGTERGATLTIEPGKVVVEVAASGNTPDPPERIDLLRFTSDTGYFTLLTLFRMKLNTRVGVGSLATYSVWLAFENGYFESPSEICSRSWSMRVGDVAKILHVNGVQQTLAFPSEGGMSAAWMIASPPAVELDCPDAHIRVRFGQTIKMSGNAIDGPNLTLGYPLEIVFADEVGPETALQMMHRIRQFLSMLMGRVLPIDEASVRFELESGPHDSLIHGIHAIESAEKPDERLLANTNPDELARLLNNWLARYEELEDAIHLHTSGLLHRTLPKELRFQIFVQALEALHRRTGSTSIPIDRAPVLAALRDAGVPDDMVDRVGGVLAHAHEPGLRQRLRDLWNLMAAELEALRPGIRRRNFIGRVVATRNHYAHRTDRDSQVLDGADLWDATETIKAISHMALLLETGVDLSGMGQQMLNRRFAEFSLRD